MIRVNFDSTLLLIQFALMSTIGLAKYKLLHVIFRSELPENRILLPLLPLLPLLLPL